MNYSNDFNSFLRKAKALVKTPPQNGTIHIVIGNEAADLDSVVSAVVYAFYLSRLPQVFGELYYVPIISVPQDDVFLRTDIVALLVKLKIPVEDFIYLSDVNLNSLPISNVTLVDFNNKANHIKELEEQVCQIIDHHEESEDFNNIKKNIKTVGSCATLIAEEIHYSQQSILPIHPISYLLLSAILIDTYNLDLHSGRTTELDIFMGELLTQHSKEDPDQLFDYLQKAKMDISSMTTYNILRKDYKPVPSSASVKLGISSATISASLLLSRDDLVMAAKDYMLKVNVDVLVIMFLSFNINSTSPLREIAFVSMVPDSLTKVTSYILSFQNDLELIEKYDVRCDFKNFVRLFDQNPKLSRKFVLPLLKKTE